ncbi:MAG: hypothetical protein MJE68_03580 [Proteobacteria bacterium]|nr:hypothetical protein [Pseudomonadota bacterium]
MKDAKWRDEKPCCEKISTLMIMKAIKAMNNLCLVVDIGSFLYQESGYLRVIVFTSCHQWSATILSL